MDKATQQKRLLRLKKQLEWSRACFGLVESPHWAAIKEHLDLEQKAVGLELVSMKVKPDQMQIVAERMKSRADWVEELEGTAKLVHKREEEYETLSKLLNRH